MLEVRDLVRRFGGVIAADRVSLRVDEGDLHGVIGPNGAGKSTLFNLVIGLLRPNSGRILLRGQEIQDRPPEDRARMGIAIAFQQVRLFRGMSVLENVMVGAQTWSRHGFCEAALRLGRHRREEREIRRAAESAIETVGITTLAERPAEALPLGQQRAVQLARALCARPRLLLLDEPASGLRGAERNRLVELIRSLNSAGLTMLLIEHDVNMVARLARNVTVLDRGEVIADGPMEEVRHDPRVIAAYLGTPAGSDA